MSRLLPKRKVWLVAEMVKDEGTSYFLNEIKAVFGDERGANAEAESLSKDGGTFSVFEHEVRHALLM